MSADRLPRARLQRRRPRRAPARRDRAASASTASRSRPSPRLRDRAGRRDPRPARLPQRRAGSGPPSSRSSCSTLCKAVEAEGGRLFGGPRHGPRPLDVDVLLLGDIELEQRAAHAPASARSRSRRFVLVPLLELDPDLALPDGTRLAGALDRLEGERVEPRRGAAARRSSPRRCPDPPGSLLLEISNPATPAGWMGGSERAGAPPPR